MPRQRFTNNAVGELNVQCLSTDLSLTLKTGQGAKFPSPTGGDFFVATLQNNSTVEIVRCTARSGDVLTIVRGQESTSATTFPADTTTVELRATAGGFERFLQELTGQMFIDMGVIDLAGVGGFENAVLETPEIIDPLLKVSTIYPVDENPANAIVLPNGGGRPSVGGSPIATDSTVAATVSPLVTAIDTKQPVDGDLTALAALTGTGYMRRTGTDAYALSATIPYSDISGVPAAGVNGAANLAGGWEVYAAHTSGILYFRTLSYLKTTTFAGNYNNKVIDCHIGMDYSGNVIRVILNVVYGDDLTGVGVGVGVGME